MPEVRETLSAEYGEIAKLAGKAERKRSEFALFVLADTACGN
jgi:hypothetical protein